MNRKIKILKAVDALVGALAAAALPPARRGEVATPRRFLLIRPGGIGDAVLLIPALHAIRERFPAAEISVLAEQRNAPAFALTGAVDCLLRYDRPSELVRALRGGYDVVIDSEQWYRLSAVVARLTRPPLSIGFATNRRKRLFSRQISYSLARYEPLSFLDLLAPLGIAAAAPRVPFLTVPEPAAVRAAELLAPLRGRPPVVIFPGGSIAEKRWGARRFGEVARRLAGAGFAVVLLGGEDAVQEGELILGGVKGCNLAGKTTLAESAAVIARSALLISGDSGLLHIAVGLGVPTVSLFGPGSAEKWGPRGEGDVVLNRRLPCSPCTRFGAVAPCPFQSRCMGEIPVDDVVAAAMAALLPSAP